MQQVAEAATALAESASRAMRHDPTMGGIASQAADIALHIVSQARKHSDPLPPNTGKCNASSHVTVPIHAQSQLTLLQPKAAAVSTTTANGPPPLHPTASCLPFQRCSTADSGGRGAEAVPVGGATPRFKGYNAMVHIVQGTRPSTGSRPLSNPITHSVVQNPEADRRREAMSRGFSRFVPYSAFCFSRFIGQVTPEIRYVHD